MLVVALPNGRSFAVDAPAGASPDALRAAVEKATGAPLGTQTLVDAAGAPATAAAAGLRVAGAALAPPQPPPPPAADGGVTITVKPRLQKETWSMYWKETMTTKTTLHDAFTASFHPSARVADVAAAAAARAGWTPPPTDADRLPGFTSPWTTAFVRGHAVSLDATLASAGAAAGGEVVIVRMMLKPEKWSVIPSEGDAAAEDEDDDDASTSSDEEDAGAGGGLWCGI